MGIGLRLTAGTSTATQTTAQSLLLDGNAADPYLAVGEKLSHGRKLSGERLMGLRRRRNQRSCNLSTSRLRLDFYPSQRRVVQAYRHPIRSRAHNGRWCIK